MSSTIPQSLSAFTRLSGNCGSSPLLTSSRRQRRSCDASSKPTTSPIEIFVIRQTGRSTTLMCFGRFAKLAVKTCVFRQFEAEIGHALDITFASAALPVINTASDERSHRDVFLNYTQ